MIFIIYLNLFYKMTGKNRMPEKLVEIKKGQTGTGILIESDGYVSKDLTENNRKIIKEAFDSSENGEWNIPNPFVLDVVLQKFGIQNANGRIYPEAVLKREVEKYQARIRDHRALGECYTPDVMILCESGWKELKDVTEDDNVLTLNTNTNNIEIQKVSRKIEYDYNGDMVCIEGKSISDKVTPNHGYPIYNKEGVFSAFYTANDIFNHEVKDQSHSFIPKQGNWCGTSEDFFMLKGVKSPNKTMLKKHPYCMEDKKIPMTTFMKFMGIYLSEGHSSKFGNDVKIYDIEPNVCDMIAGLMIELGLEYTINVSKTGRHTFRISDPRLHAYTKPLGDDNSVYIPFELKQQSKDNLTALYDWFILGRDKVRHYKKNKSARLNNEVFTESKQLALDLNEIQFKIGYCGDYRIEEDNTNMYFTFRTLSNGAYLDDKFIKLEKVPYSGKVMCIEVPNHTFYVMSNGKCHWSKNCNHPAESTIDLGRISHNIIECHWEKHTLVGKIEFNLTEGFRRYGICSSLGDTCANLILNGYKIGVSSRGIGSVKSVLGKTIVDDDFELLCWDIVSDPSTPNAYIGEKEELQQYVENKENDSNKSKLNEKIGKLKKILQ